MAMAAGTIVAVIVANTRLTMTMGFDWAGPNMAMTLNGFPNRRAI